MSFGAIDVALMLNADNLGQEVVPLFMHELSVVSEELIKVGHPDPYDFLELFWLLLLLLFTAAPFKLLSFFNRI
jgi:hypothetical protein